MYRKGIIVASVAVALGVLLTGCSNESHVTTGNPKTYEWIRNQTDCKQLSDFAQKAGEHVDWGQTDPWQSYYDTAYDRFYSIGCAIRPQN